MKDSSSIHGKLLQLTTSLNCLWCNSKMLALPNAIYWCRRQSVRMWFIKKLLLIWLFHRVLIMLSALVKMLHWLSVTERFILCFGFQFYRLECWHSSHLVTVGTGILWLRWYTDYVCELRRFGELSYVNCCMYSDQSVHVNVITM